MKKIFLYVGIPIILIILALVFYPFLFGAQDVNVRLKWKHQAQFAGMYVADKKWYYRFSGLNVSLKEIDFNLNQAEELERGESDFAVVSPEEFITFLDNGYDFVAIASIYQTSPWVMVSLEKAGITSPADLVGKKIGNKGGKLESDIFIDLISAQYGISKSDFELIDLPFGDTELEDLLSSKVDTLGLYRTDQIYEFEKSRTPYNLIKPEEHGFVIGNDLIITNRETIKENEKMVDDFIRATTKGWDFALKNIDTASDISLGYVTDKNYNDFEIQKYILENSQPLIKESTSKPIGLINESSLLKLYDFMITEGLVGRDFILTDYIDNSFIK